MVDELLDEKCMVDGWCMGLLRDVLHTTLLGGG